MSAYFCMLSCRHSSHLRTLACGSDQMNTPHYRRNYKAGHDNTTAYDLLDLVLIAGLTKLLKEGECETMGELFRELEFLMEENGLTTRRNQETGEREVCMVGGVK